MKSSFPNLFLAVALLLVLSGCQLPFLPGPSRSTETTPSPIDRIPPVVLTDVAATLFATMAATPTTEPVDVQRAAPSPTHTQVPEVHPTDTALPTPTAPKPVPATSTPLPTSLPIATNEAEPPFVVTLAPGYYSEQPIGGLPGQYPEAPLEQPVYPLESLPLSGTGGFSIRSVNLPACGGILAANFLISNHSGNVFESYSLTITDLSNGLVIYGPSAGNAPFMYDDRACAPGGVNSLSSGYSLFTGAVLSVPNLSRHTLQAAFIFCTRDNLAGRCYSRSTQFVVP